MMNDPSQLELNYNRVDTEVRANHFIQADCDSLKGLAEYELLSIDLCCSSVCTLLYMCNTITNLCSIRVVSM